jgi:hypothetical protein
MDLNRTSHLSCSNCPRLHCKCCGSLDHRSHRLCSLPTMKGFPRVPWEWCNSLTDTRQSHRSSLLCHIFQQRCSSLPRLQRTACCRSDCRTGQWWRRQSLLHMRLRSMSHLHSPLYKDKQCQHSSTVNMQDGRSCVMCVEWTHIELPQVQVLELQHWNSVPKHVALPCDGPQSPLSDLSGSMTVPTNPSSAPRL